MTRHSATVSVTKSLSSATCRSISETTAGSELHLVAMPSRRFAAKAAKDRKYTRTTKVTTERRTMATWILAKMVPMMAATRNSTMTTMWPTTMATCTTTVMFTTGLF
jgi:hypothetical protein